MGRPQPLTNRQYDIRGHSIWRVLRQELIFRVMPFGSFGGGPNLFYIARLLLVHTVGRLWFFLAVPLVRMVRQVRHAIGRMRSS